jgi:hypothetical protein
MGHSSTTSLARLGTNPEPGESKGQRDKVQKCKGILQPDGAIEIITSNYYLINYDDYEIIFHLWCPGILRSRVSAGRPVLRQD